MYAAEHVAHLRRYEWLVRKCAYFKPVLYVLDAAELIHLRGNVDDPLLLVALGPFHCQA